MTWWSPKPLSWKLTSPLFTYGDNSYTVTQETPIQRQRRIDGSPHTNTRLSSLAPKDPTLYLAGVTTKVEKSKTVVGDSHSRNVDPDFVIKSYLYS